MSKPTLFKCALCGAKAISPTDDLPLMVRNKVSSRLEEQRCACGGAFQPAAPFFVVKHGDLSKIQIICTPCHTPFRRVSPSRFSCTSCNAVGHIVELEIWFESDQVKISYESN